ncbi:MAG: hypothetical protein DRJ64_07155 [Thermoprotei archaeon]|nr:MAG: hypothetical protein DRJ64_07155 [Thermoprotei archaeon]
MSFFGSTDRYSFGAGVSKLLEDRPEDWWSKYLVTIANGVKGQPMPTGGGLVSQINKLINPVIGDKFGHTFEGQINRSYADEVLLFDAIGDPCKEEVLDYNIGISTGMQSSKYMYETYGNPSYSGLRPYMPYWNVNGEDVYVKIATVVYKGEYPDVQPDKINLDLYIYTTDILSEVVEIPYSREKICAITYRTNCPYTKPGILVNDANEPLVNDEGFYLTDDNGDYVDQLMWYCDASEVVIEKYAYESFFVMDYKRRGSRNKSKYLFLLNNRLSLGNTPDPCFDDSGSSEVSKYGIKDSFSGKRGHSSAGNAYYNWDTTIRKEAPSNMFSVNPNTSTGTSCAEHKDKLKKECMGIEDGDDYEHTPFSFGGGKCGSVGEDPSTLEGIINKKENKTVLFTHAVAYIDDETNDKHRNATFGVDHPQRAYQDAIDQLLDKEGKYDLGFKPAHTPGKEANSNYRGKGLGGYLIRVHDVEIAYVDYFVISQDPNDYGTIDKGLSVIGKDEKVPDQCETRDPRTGYSMVLDTYPVRTVNNNSDGGCEDEFNDTVIQYMLPYYVVNDGAMTDRYRCFKESACIMVQATQYRKLEWYETGLFKLAIIIVQLWISVVTLGAGAALGLFAIGILIDQLNINPYFKLAIQIAIGAMTGGVSALMSTTNVLSILQQVATIAFSEYAKDEMTRIREEGEELDEEKKAVDKAMNKMKRDALYTPLDEIDELYSQSYELLYSSYGVATSVEGMTELDKKGIQ